MQTINFLDLEEQRFKWSIMTFPEATPKGSLMKAISELDEIMESPLLPEEYADFVMCVLDCAQRSKISINEILMEMSDRVYPNVVQYREQNALLRLIQEYLKEVSENLESNDKIHSNVFAHILILTILLANENSITIFEILVAYQAKIEINKKRTWVKNPDNSYSHKKNDQP